MVRDGPPLGRSRPQIVLDLETVLTAALQLGERRTTGDGLGGPDGASAPICWLWGSAVLTSDEPGSGRRPGLVPHRRGRRPPDASGDAR